MNIWFTGKHNAHLSNLAHRPFKDLAGRMYYSVEHAYQTWKSGKFDAVAYHAGQYGGKIVGRMGTNFKTNIALMEKLIMASFKQNKNHAEELIATGDVIFTHTQDRGIWREKFPEILMKVRAELKEAL